MDLSVHLHPMLVHFPIALTVTAVFFALIAWKIGGEAWLFATRWLLIGAALGGVLGAAAGWWAEESGSRPASVHALMDRHEDLGYWVAGLLAVLAIWGWKRSAKWIFWPALAVMMIVFYQGYLGGQLVYVHGVGVAGGAVSQVPAAGQPDGASAEDHPHRGVQPKGFGDGSIPTH